MNVLVVGPMVIARLFRACAKNLSGHGFGKNSIVSNVYFLLARKFLPDFVIFRGHKIFLDSENSINLANFGYDIEEYELSLFENEVNVDSIVVDIGSNIGLYTLTAAKHAQQVYSFEPDPISFSNLKKNIDGNVCKNVTLINKAVSDVSGKAEFSSSSKRSSRGSNHLISSFEKRVKESVTVQLVALDEFFRDKDIKIDVVKIDIEGAEYEAIKGMEKLIAANRSIKLFLEFNPYALNRRGTDIALFLDYLYSLDFSTYYIDETEKRKICVTKKWLLDFAVQKKDGHYINLLCVRNLMG